MNNEKNRCPKCGYHCHPMDLVCDRCGGPHPMDAEETDKNGNLKKKDSK